MPKSITIAAAANRALAPGAIDEFDPELLAPGRTLEDAIKGLGATLTPEDEAFLESIPPAIKEGIRATLFSAVTRGNRVPVTMAWAPSGDFELRVWEAAGNPGAMTILLKGPRPAGVAAPA
jgi:hypothetical protein